MSRDFQEEIEPPIEDKFDEDAWRDESDVKDSFLDEYPPEDRDHWEPAAEDRAEIEDWPIAGPNADLDEDE